MLSIQILLSSAIFDTFIVLEKRLAALEDGIGAVAVGSGMAAAY